MPVSQADFIQIFEKLGPEKTAKKLGVGVRAVYQRRGRVEGLIGRQLVSPAQDRGAKARTRVGVEHPGRINMDVKDGTVLICSDGHFWPGEASTAHRAFVKFVKDMKPKLVVMNGDALDGATISRHAPIGWEGRPTLIQELEACQERLGEIEQAAARGVPLVWTLGNHDGRFETRIATMLPELAKIEGVHLKDHFGDRWQPCWSLWINDDVVVKHRFRSGIHAAHNNVMWSGKTIVTGHTHALRVNPFPDYNGVRYGVETGCIADVNGRQFLDYTEDNPKRWESGFAVLTFKDGALLPPELVTVWGPDTVTFRGQIIRV